MVDAATNLRYARRRAALSQRELAARTGVAQPTIARIERGLVSPRLATLERLLAACDYRLVLSPLEEERTERSRTREVGADGEPTIAGVFSADGVDLTVIRWMLERSPEERLEAAQGLIDVRSVVCPE